MRGIYKFNNYVKFFKVNDINMIGNINNGSIIGLNSDGMELVSKIKKDQIIDVLPSNSKMSELLAEMQTLSFFEDTKSNNLTSAYLHITDACNLNCVGCYSFVENRNSLNELSTKDIYIILDKLHTAGVRKIIISGGEPFLREDLKDICKYAKNNLELEELTVISNGTIQIQKYLDVIPYIDILSVSVDGYSENSRFIRNSNIMPQIINLVKEIKDQVNVHLISTLHKKNKHLMKEYLGFSKELGVSLSFSIFTVDNSLNKYDEWVLNHTDLEDIAHELSGVDNKNIEALTFLDKMNLSCRVRCEAGKSLVSVDAKGNLYPCHMLHIEKFRLGNLLTEDILNILNNNNSFNSVNVEEFKVCFKCDFKYLCGGGCRGRSYYKYGSIKYPDSYCKLYHNYYIEFFNSLEKALKI